MRVSTHLGLLGCQHLDKPVAMGFFLERFEQ